MPTVREIEEALFRFAPEETAMEWDNVGHLVGDPDQKVQRVLVTLDITQAVADEAIAARCDLIVAHHPVMNCYWHKVQSVRSDRAQGRLLTGLLKHDVAAICMHTNLDRAVGGVNDCLAEKLGLRDPVLMPGGDGFCRMGTLSAPMSLETFVQQVSAALDCRGIRYADAGKPVFRVASGGGACGEFTQAAIEAGCDTFVTSDLKYHGFLDAVADGINLIDAGHFPTENPVCEVLVSLLENNFPTLTVIRSASHTDVIQYYVEGE